jgi:hypothetical protein
MKNPESLIGRQNKIIQYMFKALDYCKAFPDSKYHCEMAIQQYMAFKRECLPEETNSPNKSMAAEETKSKHLNYITQKAKIWAEINYLEAGYKRLNEQIASLEKDKKDMANVIKQNLADLQNLHENNSHYE